MPQTAETEIQHLVDALFALTDEKAWQAAGELFVDGPIDVDMTSVAGGAPAQMSAKQLIQGFEQGLHAGKISHHMATNYRTTMAGSTASVLAQGYSWNHVPGLPDGHDLWETWGTYRIDARATSHGWRLCAFRYFSKLTRGDDAVRTHQPHKRRQTDQE
jgi:hypothetical protein